MTRAPQTCVRCGRANPEATAFTGPACHPAWVEGRSCYTDENYEWTFRKNGRTIVGRLLPWFAP